MTIPRDPSTDPDEGQYRIRLLPQDALLSTLPDGRPRLAAGVGRQPSTVRLRTPDTSPARAGARRTIT